MCSSNLRLFATPLRVGITRLALHPACPCPERRGGRPRRRRASCTRRPVAERLGKATNARCGRREHGVRVELGMGASTVEGSTDTRSAPGGRRGAARGARLASRRSDGRSGAGAGAESARTAAEGWQPTSIRLQPGRGQVRLRRRVVAAVAALSAAVGPHGMPRERESEAAPSQRCGERKAGAENTFLSAAVEK